MKKTILKDNISILLYYIYVSIIFINIMLLAELNNCILFYSISLNLCFILHYILKNKTSKKFYNNYIKLDDEI